MPQRSFFAALRACAENDWFRALLLVVVGFVVRLPALQGLPIWDDDYLVRENPFAKSPLLIGEAFRHYLFVDSLSLHYRPVQNISLALDYLVWNSATCGYHLTNVLLHLGSSLGLFLLLLRLLPQLLSPTVSPALTRACAFFVTLLWVVHPVHSAAVDYISGRADSLAFFFSVAGWLLFLFAQRNSSRVRRGVIYAGAAVCGLVALCSREIACVWLVLFLFHTFIFQQRLTLRGKFVALACCLALLGSYILLRHLPEHRDAPPVAESWTAPTRAVLMLRALGDYGRLMIWPSTLRMERNVIDPENFRSTQSWRQSASSEYLSLLGLAVLAVFICGALRKGPGRTLRICGLGWFAAGYLPVSNLVTLNATVAEHWLYLPSVGFLLFLAGFAVEVPPRFRLALAGLATVAICGLGARAYVRSSDWVDPQTFYERTIAAGKSSVRMGINLGGIYADRGELAKAEAVFRKVLQITPNHPLARHNLADVLNREGKREEAEALSVATHDADSQTKKDYPRTWLGAVQLAAMRKREGDAVGALAILQEAQHEYPEAWMVVRDEADLLRGCGESDRALQLVAEFARDHWWHHGATLSFGQLLAARGELELAAEQLRFASWLDVHDARALNLLASVRFRQHRFTDAFAAQSRAVARQPDEPSQYGFLAQILEAMGRSDEARAAVAHIAALRASVATTRSAN